ncbi:SRPBCC family protein [Mycobacterium sp.]|uniref:SRPBCC family protein n=1 Tax=Mycobacterium sp. TaxID=1785 RepID=UPI0031D44988
MIGDPVVQVTEGVWIDSPPSVTWPWLLQMGQDRGARYSRRALEYVSGLRMHNPDGLNPEWKELAVGDTLQLRPKGWMGLPDGLSLHVDAITPERSIVLRATSPNLPRVLWSFHLQPHWATHTRLLARVRVGLRHPGEVVAVELVRPVIALLLRKVLLDIKRRVQRQANEFAAADFAP